MSVAVEAETPVPQDSGWWPRIEAFLLSSVEHLNPILIKEARQSLKSRQFVVTFLLTLLACWIASFAVIGIVGMEVFYVASGDQMLTWYCCILSFPLFIVVPYSAYRSITSEQEDNTYDLLSITSLTSRQIVTGKLGSALVQMLVYLSAVSPCIAFTFLLRGVDLLQVAFILVAYFHVSLGASMIALMIGTAAKVRYTQALTSVLVVLGLFGIFMGGIFITIEFIAESDQMIRDSDFWIGMAALFTLYVTTFVLLHSAAAAQIAFSSENRSTRLRWCMLLQTLCFLGWIVGILSVGWRPDRWRFVGDAVSIVSLFAAGYWYFMGTLLTSEWPHLSRRVQRSLPQSCAGQVFLTWLNPGPGTGFMYAIASLTTVVLGGMLAMLYFYDPRFPGAVPGLTNDALYIAGFAWCYVVIFLGLGSLMISLLRRYFFISMTAGFLIHVILVLMACGIPQVITLSTNYYGRGDTYSLLQSSNPFWTLIEASEGRGFSFSPEASILVYVLPAVAAIILLLCFRIVAADLRHGRRSLPERVAEDEAELRPQEEVKPSSPWDLPSDAD